MFCVVFMVVNAEAPSVVSCMVVAGVSCVVTFDNSVVALLSSVLDVLESVVFRVVNAETPSVVTCTAVVGVS